MTIVFKPVPLGQARQFCLDPLQEHEINLQVRLAEIDEDTGEGNENNPDGWRWEEGTNTTNAVRAVCGK